MTDIVERLRKYVENIRGKDEPPENYLCWQAADEIERLRAEDDLCHKAADEIERLRAENETLRGNHAGADEYEAAQDEIERLREALATCRELREYDRVALERTK